MVSTDGNIDHGSSQHQLVQKGMFSRQTAKLTELAKLIAMMRGRDGAGKGCCGWTQPLHNILAQVG